MHDKSNGGKLGGLGASVEIDETFIGGSSRFMRSPMDSSDAGKRGEADAGNKTIMLGILDRAGTVRIA